MDTKVKKQATIISGITFAFAFTSGCVRLPDASNSQPIAPEQQYPSQLTTDEKRLIQECQKYNNLSALQCAQKYELEDKSPAQEQPTQKRTPSTGSGPVLYADQHRPTGQETIIARVPANNTQQPWRHNGNTAGQSLSYEYNQPNQDTPIAQNRDVIRVPQNIHSAFKQYGSFYLAPEDAQYCQIDEIYNGHPSYRIEIISNDDKRLQRTIPNLIMEPSSHLIVGTNLTANPRHNFGEVPLAVIDKQNNYCLIATEFGNRVYHLKPTKSHSATTKARSFIHNIDL